MFQQGRRPYPPMLSNQQVPFGDELLGYPPQPAGYYVADDPQEFLYTPEGDVIVMPPIMAYEEDNGQYMSAGMQSPYDPNYLPQDDVVFVPVDAPDFMPRDMPPPSNYRPLPPQQQQLANYRPQQQRQQQQQQPELTQYVPAAPQQQPRTSNYDEEPLTLVIQKKKQKKKKSRKCRHDDDSDEDSDDDDECDCNCRRVSRPPVNYAFIPVMIPQPAAPQPVAAPAPAPAPAPVPVQPAGITWFASGIRPGGSQYEEQQRDAIVAERLGYQIQRNCCM